jgi:hypothetical protein
LTASTWCASSFVKRALRVRPAGMVSVGATAGDRSGSVRTVCCESFRAAREELKEDESDGGGESVDGIKAAGMSG